MMFAAAAFAILLHIASAEESSLSRTYDFPDTHLVTNWPMRDNANLVYAHCNSSQLGKQCIVGVKFDAFENSTGATNECEIHLKPEMTNATVNDTLYVFEFSHDKVLVVWTEAQKAENKIEWTMLKTTVVHVLDNCQNFEVMVHKYSGQPLDLDALPPTVVTFQDTYELILKNVTHECTPGAECQSGYGVYKFDSHARNLSGPEHWEMTPVDDGVNFISSAEIPEPNEAYLIDSYSDKSLSAELMSKGSPDHKKLELWKTTCDEEYDEHRVTLTNKAIGMGFVCGNRTLTCWQADQNGKILINTQLTFERPYIGKLPFMYNMRNGGLLLAVIKCKESEWNINHDYRLLKVDSQGQVLSVNVQFDTECPYEYSYPRIRIFENKQNQYCLVRLCNPQNAQLDTSVRCYSSDEFSKCVNCL